MKPSAPKLLLHAEGPAVVRACTFYARAGFSWGWFAATLLLPDALMLAYLAGPRTGAVFYNLGHTYLAPLFAAAVLIMVDLVDWLWIPLV